MEGFGISHPIPINSNISKIRNNNKGVGNKSPHPNLFHLFIHILVKKKKKELNVFCSNFLIFKIYKKIL